MKWLWLTCIIVLASGGAFAQALMIYTEESPPANYTGADGKPAGYCYEIVVEIQKRLGNKDPILFLPWARGLAALDSTANVLLFATNRTAERDPKYQWIGPVGENIFAFYSRASDPIVIASMEDAKKVARIGVYLNDVRDQILTAKGFTNLDRSNDVLTPIRMLMSGRLNLVTSTPDEIGPLLGKAGFKVADVKMQYVFQKTQIFIAASKQTSPALVKAWNDTLDAMKKDGTFEKIYRKYLPSSPLPGPAITNF